MRKNYQEISDEQLMVLLGEKDQRAFRELYQRYSKRMLNFFYKMLWQDRLKAEDFMQELFTKLIHKPHLYDEKRAFKTWIYSIANNMCKNEYRKQEIRKGTNLQIEYDVVGESGEQAIKSMDYKNFNQKIDFVLAKIDTNKKETFELRYRQEMSIKEISEIMECSEGTVKSRIFYTLKILNSELKEFETMLKD